MRTIAATALALFLAPLALAQQYYLITYDPAYDVANTSTSDVACSSQLAAEGYLTYGSIPSFPSLGGSANLTSGDTSFCGLCYVFEFAGNFAGVKLINAAAHADFVVSEEAMDFLTNNVTTYPHVYAQIVQGPYAC